MQRPADHSALDDAARAAAICDRFVPLRVPQLVDALVEEQSLAGREEMTFRAVASAMHDVIEQEASRFERELLELYARADPDAVRSASLRPPSRDPAYYRELDGWLSYLLEKANFTRLEDVQLAEALRIARARGLRVRLNPERIESITIWVRGRGEASRMRRTWRHPVRGVAEAVDVFRRLAIVVRLRDEACVSLKLFKDIPIDDVEALLPHAEVAMSWFDHLKTVGGSFTALGSTAMRLITITVLALTTLVWLLSIGLMLVTYRLIIGYRQARLHRDTRRTRHLYYQNLANNAAALHTLVAMIAEEDIKEALIAYALALHRGAPDAEPLHRRIDRFLTGSCRCDEVVRFDLDDAVCTLERLRLWNDRDERVALPADAALRRLREHWELRRTERHHCVLAGRRAGD